MIKPFVEIEWVEERRGEVMIADCRWYLDGRSGHNAYEGGHVPGAVFVDLDAALTHHGVDPAAAGRHPLPEPTDFAAAMGALGIGDHDTVIAYDDAGGVIAGRLVWMLRVTGHEAALLDGGLGAWRGELATGRGTGGTEFGETDRDPVEFTAREWPAERIAAIEEVAAASEAATADRDGPADATGRDDEPATATPYDDDPTRAAPGAARVLIDARQRERFEGEPDEADPAAGHIPGARSVPCRENLDADGRLLPVEQLRARFDFGDTTEVISYCGSGVTACHNLLAMEQAGLGPGRLFPGSWSQWSRDPARPVQTGAGSPR
jgi:thiosulfate/3-mercaptopyruvate sulfurtransferase